MADAGFLELQQGTEPATPSAGLDRVYVDSADDHLKHKRPDGTVIDLDTGGAAGSVTSVALSAPPEFVVTGSPVTSAGTLTLTKSNENPNTVWAGPTSGSAVQPTFRSLVSNDIPNLDFSKITTGTVPIARGGTNSTTALNNNRVIQSFAGAIVEANAITPNQALISDANGIPTQSTTTATELSYVSGTTSNIQAQINNKEPSITTLPISKGGTNSSTALTGNKAIISNATQIIESTTTSTEIGYVSGVTSSIQTQINGKVSKSGDTMTGTLNVPEIILTDTAGNGFVEHPRQVSPPSTPASGHGYRHYADSTGKFAWKGENGFVRTFDGLANTADRTYTLPDASGTLTIDPTTTTGDLIYKNSGVLTRLPIGNSNQVLTVSSGLPSWMDPNINGFGDRSDGTLSVTGTVSLTNPVYYDTLTISGAGSITTNGYPVYCRILDLSNAAAGAIDWSGNPGNNSTGTAGGAAPGAGANAYLGGGGNGTAGGASSTTTGATAGAPAGQNPGNGGRSNTSGAGGAGAAGAEAGGAARAGASVTNSVKFGMVNSPALFMRNTSLLNGGSGGGGGGGGGGSGTQAGTGGGSGGGGGNNQAIFAQTIITSGSTASGAIRAKGGNGGSSGNSANANSGTGGGGAGGGGGYIYLVYMNKTGSAVADLIDCSGGSGGNAGNANGTGAGGNGGNGGDGGNIDIINAITRTGNHVLGASGSAGTSGSGITGGTGGNGGSCVFSL